LTSTSPQPESRSPAESLACLPASQRETWLSSLSSDEVQALPFEWRFWARPKQIAPAGDWRFWIVKAGRGFGKTRTGAEWVREKIESGKCRRIALVSDTAADVRDVMVEGPSGLINIAPPWNKPLYEPSKRRVTWPNGAVAICYAAEAPELLRGPEHDGAWADEFAKWKNLRKRDAEGGTAWDNLLMGLRIGDNPQGLVTTTPRSIAELRSLLKRPGVVITGGSSYENRGNLSEQWFSDVILSYEGTRLGRQEIHAEILDDAEGALWQRGMFEKNRKSVDRSFLTRVVIAIDPATTKKKRSDETGIVACGIGKDGHGYVLEDAGAQMSTDAWTAKAIHLYDKWGADRIVAETNNGGDLVEYALRTKRANVSYKSLTASRGSMVRAEPVAALYEQNRVHHGTNVSRLEDNMCNWEAATGEHCPDNVSAAVWGLTELMLERTQAVASITVDNAWQRSKW
jgi:phage terminase large subunit-like protein